MVLFSYKKRVPFLIPKGKDGKRMKKIKMFMGAVLCMNLLTLSGCDRVVQSAVVEEKDQTEQKKEEKKETVQKTVAEQVQAPETYQTTIQADLRSADREDKETPMNFTLTADAPVKVPDVDAICLKKVKRMAISEEEQNKIKDTFGKGQSMQEEKNENEQAGTYTVDGLTYRYSYTQSEQVSDVEELGFQIAKFSFDDCGDMTLASSEKKEREERFQNYIKAGSGKVSEKEAKEKVSGLVSGDWELFESSSKALTEGNTTLEKDDFIFERALDGIPVNYVREQQHPHGPYALYLPQNFLQVLSQRLRGCIGRWRFALTSLCRVPAPTGP